MARHLEPGASAPQQPSQSPPRRVMEAEEESELAPEDRGRSVREHTQRYMDSGEFAERKGALAKGVRDEVASLKAEVEQKFDHHLGTLQTEQVSADYNVQQRPTTTNPIAASIMEMLSSPKHIRSAIVLNEILQRPRVRK